MNDDNLHRKARERIARRRANTDSAYDRAYYRATRRLIEEHRQEFSRLLAEERERV